MDREYIRELLLKQARQTIQTLFELKQSFGSESMEEYLMGKMDAYREVLYTLGMSHSEIEFQINLPEEQNK